MAKEGPIVDPIGVKLRIAKRQDGIAVRGRPQLLDQGATVHQLAAARRLVDHASSPAGQDAGAVVAERRRARALRITENLEREQGRGI